MQKKRRKIKIMVRAANIQTPAICIIIEGNNKRKKFTNKYSLKEWDRKQKSNWNSKFGWCQSCIFPLNANIYEFFAFDLVEVNNSKLKQFKAIISSESELKNEKCVREYATAKWNRHPDNLDERQRWDGLTQVPTQNFINDFFFFLFFNMMFIVFVSLCLAECNFCFNSIVSCAFIYHNEFINFNEVCKAASRDFKFIFYPWWCWWCCFWCCCCRCNHSFR